MLLSISDNFAAVAPSRGHGSGSYTGRPVLVSIVLACMMTGVTGCATNTQQAAEQPAQQPISEESLAEDQVSSQQRHLEEKWGVEIQGVRLAAADYMLDFRYRVLDADKAAPILDRQIKPHVIVERTGHKLQVPISSKLGPLRQSQTHPQAGRNYYAFFANPGRHVQRGDLLTVVVGDFTVEHLMVQ